MKRVLVVEDESLVRLGICTMLAQRGTEYAVVGESEDGNKAIELILQKQPEIVLLDITIPGKNGMEVLKEIRQAGFDGYVMMLTCHENFELARQAIRYGANDYVLKSELDARDLFDYLDKIPLPSRTREANQGKSVDLAEKRQAFLSNLFLTNTMDDEGFDSSCREYAIPLTRTGLRFFLLRIPDYSHFIMRYERQEQDVLLGAMTVIASESLNKKFSHLVFRFAPETYIILYSLPHLRAHQERGVLTEAVSALHQNINVFLDTSVIIGVSEKIEQIKLLHGTFNKLTQLMQRNFFFPEELTIWESSLQDENGFYQALERLKLTLYEILKENHIAFSLEEIFSDFHESCRPPWIVPDKNAFIYLVQDFLKQLSASYGIAAPDISPEDKYIDIVGKIRPLFEGGLFSVNPQNHIASRALLYIEEHYMEDLSLESIAEKIGVSSSYLSRIFSRNVKQNISVYIMNKRLSHAKELLATTNLKNYEIAEACGLNSAAYFTSVFKKGTGLTPNQYRNTYRTRK